jgi:hypothetical protein
MYFFLMLKLRIRFFEVHANKLINNLFNKYKNNTFDQITLKNEY